MTKRAREHLAAVDPVLAQLIALAPAWRHTRNDADTFEYLVRAVAHQQLNGKAAQTIVGRFIALTKGPAFPSAKAVARMPLADLRNVGLSTAKSQAILGLAQASERGTLPTLATLARTPDDDIVQTLTQHRGIGPWTVQMMLMFRMRRPDVMPVLDFGVRNGFRLAYGKTEMPTPRALAEATTHWAPYRSYGAWLMWRAVELHTEGRLPAPKRPRTPRGNK